LKPSLPRTYREISLAFGDAVQKGAAALLIIADPLFASRPVQLATLSARHRLPAIVNRRAKFECRLTVFGSFGSEVDLPAEVRGKTPS